MTGYAVAQLQQHARRGFEESHRLFREAARSAGDANSPLGRYLSTAQSYAHSLELYSGERVGSTTGTGGAVSDRGIPGEAVFRTGSAATTYRAGEGQTGAGGGPRTVDAAGGGGAGGEMMGMVDPQTVTLVSHSVKEVLDACKLKMMARMLGENSQGVDVLRQHAQQMQAEGLQTIQALASTSDVPASRGAGGAGSGGGTASATGGSLLDAATARTRDRDVNTTSGDRGGAGTTGGTGTTGSGRSRHDGHRRGHGRRGIDHRDRRGQRRHRGVGDHRRRGDRRGRLRASAAVAPAAGCRRSRLRDDDPGPAGPRPRPDHRPAQQ